MGEASLLALAAEQLCRYVRIGIIVRPAIARISGIARIPQVTNITAIAHMFVQDHVFVKLANVLTGKFMNMGSV